MRIGAFFNRTILPVIFTMFIGAAPGYAQGAAPAPDAGRDRTVIFNGVDPVTVVLDGTGTIDGDGQQLTDDEPATPYGITWSFVSIPAGSVAALSDDQAIRPGFVLDRAGDYVIQLTANDGTSIVTDRVTISTDNSAPHADAGRDRKVALNDVVILDGSGSTDWDGDALTYSWSVTGPGGAVALGDPTAVMPSFAVTQAGDYTATLTVNDGVRSSEADQVLISTVNVPPVAVANAAQDMPITGGLTVLTLDSEGTSDLDNTDLSYRWSLLWGPVGGGFSLGDETQRRATMSKIGAGDWVVQLTVGDGAFTRNTTVLFAAGGNLAPTANAGADQAAIAGQVVTLDGTGSTDNNGDEITYRWALIHTPAGSAAAIDDPDAGRPRFTADLSGTYIAQLIVNDGITDSDPDTIVISTDTNLAPVADAGTDFFNQGLNATIQLDGTGSSDANGNPRTYRWTMLERAVRSAAVLSDPTSPTPTFIADNVGVYVIQLVVSDGLTESAPDIVMVSAKGQGGTTDVNLRPVAVAGADASQLNPALVQLDGSASFNPNDPDPINLRYRWALIHKPAGSAALLSSATAINPTYTTDVPGLYVVQLIVNDVVFDSIPGIVVVRLNTPPVADAGPDQSGFVDQAVALDGTGSSDPDLDPLTYVWSFASKPPGSLATLTGATTATPDFTPDVFGDYVVQLVVNDGAASSAPDLVVVSMVNRPPVAEAGLDQGVTAGVLVQLDGAASSDPDRQTLTHAWRFTAKPAGSLAALDSPAVANPTFTADVNGLYVLDLVVNDGFVDSIIPDTVAVRVGSGVINTAPVLDLVGARTVELGAALTFTLNATDADGDPVRYFAAPLPLPANASLDAASGLFTFRPDETQIGAVAITFGASDGLDSDSESVPITVTAPPAGTLTTLTARVLDANDLAVGTETPVVNADVTIRAVSPSPGVFGAIVAGPVKTDALGNFSIANIPLNAALIDIDGTVANLAPNGAAYMQAYEELVLITDANNVPAEPYALTRLDGTSATVYTPGVETVVTNTTLNTTVTIAATTTVTNLDGSAFSGTFTISEMPTDEIAALLPPYIFPCSVITFQSEPSKANFSQVASYTLGNPDNLPVGSVVDIWGIARPEGNFKIVGSGTVSADGLSIIPSNGLGGTPSMFFAIPRPPSAVAAVDMNGFNKRPTLFADGNLSQAYSTSGYRSLEQDRVQSLIYNSGAADPRPIVAAEVTFPANTGLPPILEGSLEVGGAAVAGPVFTGTGGYTDPITSIVRPPLVAGQPIRQALQFGASELPTGSYPYRYIASSKYNCSKTGAAVEGRLLVNNQSGSPYGAGWTIGELSELAVQDDARIVIADGDGTTRVFTSIGAIDVGDAGEELTEAPASVELNMLESDANIRVITEQITVPLTNGVRINFSSPGSAVQSGSQDRILPAGTVVNSYLIHFDPVGTTQDITRSANVTFDNVILGVVYRDADLDTSDALLSKNGIIYPTGTAGRGIEPSSTGDRIGISTDLRTFRMILRDGASFDQMRVITMAPDKEVVGNGFDTGSEGWRVAGDVNPPIYNATGGNPGGFVSATDQTTGGTWYWLAPASFLAGLDGSYNGRLAFDLQQSSTANQFNDSDLILTGAGISLHYDTPYNPGRTPAWTPYSALLSEGAGWRVNSLAGAAPTQAQFEAVLANVTELRIRGEFVTGSDVGGLDNPRIFKPAADEIVFSDFSAPFGEFTALVRNDDGTYSRRFKDGRVIVYNVDGKQESETDANGNTTFYTYDAEGRAETVTDPAGIVTTFTYTGRDLFSITDTAGRVTAFVLDPDGNLITITDPEAAVLRFVYDANQRLLASASERGFVTTHSYGSAGEWIGSGFPDGASIAGTIGSSIGLTDFGDEANPDVYILPEDRISALTDGKGNSYEMEVNQFGSLIRITDPAGRITRIERDADNLANRVLKTTDYDPSGFAVSEFDWDASGNAIVKREAAGTTLERTTRFEYEPVFSRVIKITDPSNSDPTPVCGTAGVTCFTYDEFGNATGITGPDGAVQSFTYDVRGLRLTATDANENVTNFDYDLIGRISTITDAVNTATFFTYDLAGNNTSVTVADGTLEARTTTFTYDDMNRVTSETDPAGAVTEFTYDAEGNQIVATGDTGASSTSTYDEMGRIATITDPDTGTVSHVYDENGNTTSTTDPLGNITHSTYDVVNRRIRVENPELGVIQTSYDAQDNPIEVIGARGFPIGFTYDLLGQQTGETDALGASWSKTFDSVGNLLTEIDPKGQTKTRAYDDADRLLSITATRADATTADIVSFTYDAAGNILTARDSDSSLAWSYDGLNRTATASTVVEATAETTTVQPAVTLTNVYDAVGDRRQVEAASGLTVLGTTFYDYDLQGRLERVITPSGEIIDLGYDSLGRQTRIAWASSASAGLTYGPSYERPEEILHAFGTTELARFAYGYDIDGRMRSVIEPGGTRNFTYDRKQQLTGAGFATAPESYTYDAEGNRATSHLSASYAYDDANKLTEDDAACYGYDANGNLTSKRVKIGLDCVTDTTGAITTYTWDTFDRLARIDFPDATYAAYRYDMQGRRIEKDVNGAVTRYVYDRDNIVLEFDGADTLAARYSHDAEIDRPLAMERGGQTYTYHADERGSVRLIADGLGTIVSRYDYDAFGNFETTSFEGVANPYAFTGREWDAESGLYFYRARYYDPKVGRFVSRDPLGLDAGDFTLYGYVFNNPQNWDDPFGLIVGYAGQSCFSSAGGGFIGGLFGALNATILSHVNVGIESKQGTNPEELLEDAAIITADAVGTELALAPLSGCSSNKPAPRKRKLVECHHLIPRQIFKLFPLALAGAGIFSQNIQNAIEISSEVHDRLHSGGGRGGEWNRRWREFFEDPRNRRLTKQKIVNFRNRLMRDMGVPLRTNPLMTYRNGKCVPIAGKMLTQF